MTHYYKVCEALNQEGKDLLEHKEPKRSKVNSLCEWPESAQML